MAEKPLDYSTSVKVAPEEANLAREALLRHREVGHILVLDDIKCSHLHLIIVHHERGNDIKGIRNENIKCVGSQANFSSGSCGSGISKRD